MPVSSRSFPTATSLQHASAAHEAVADAGRRYYDLAVACVSRGDICGAISAYEMAVRYAPDFAEALSNLGNLYLQNGRSAEAVRAFEKAISAKPDLAPLYCNLAAALIALERCDDAIAASGVALRLAPDLYEAHANLSRAHQRSGRVREALALALRATKLRPDRDAYVYLAAAAFNLDAMEIAIDANRRALELDAACAAAHCNLGWLYHLAGSHSQAIASCETAIDLQPDFALAHVNLALSLLVCGDLVRGWDEYGWLWRVPERRAQFRYLDGVPLWSGEDFAGRRLLITPDQGFGDAIQMVRYLPAVKARGGRVILEVKAPLVALFADLPGIDELRIHTGGSELANQVDLRAPMLGLPRAIGTDLDSIPASIPYLWAQPERIERWRPRLRSAARLRVGIAWAGNPDHENDRRRSVSPEEFAVLGEISDIAWFGLQKGRNDERWSCGSLKLDALGSEIGDFADTAAIISLLDLVIAVDTSVVHLAGAMGTPVWTLLPFAPDWRWLLARNDSPWYPTMRLFRQPTAGDWASVFANVAGELRSFAQLARTVGEGVAFGALPFGDLARVPSVVDEPMRDDTTIGHTYYDRAKACALKGDLRGAISAYETAVSYAPDFAEAQSNLGNLYLQTGRHADALRAFRTAVQAKPDLAPLYCNLAAVQIDLGCHDEAIATLDTALRLAPDLREAHANLCLAYRRSGRNREALVPALRAIELRPDRDAFLDFGATAFGLGAFELAIDANRRALELDATCAEAQSNLGWLYHRTGRGDEAMAACEAAIALRPDFAEAHGNLAAVYHQSGRYAEAIEACQAAIALQPDFAMAHCNLGMVYHSTGRYCEAIVALETAIALLPDLVAAHVNLALSLLIRGDFAHGWEEYAWVRRVSDPGATYPCCERLPHWTGELFAGRKLLVSADQGYGDAIQLVRYLPAVKARGGRVILEVRAPLITLFADVPGVDELRVQPDGATVPAHVDLHVPLSALPGAFGTDLGSIPASVPYLRAQPERVERWSPRLRSSARLRVGIMWAGNPEYPNDCRRSARLEDFEPLGEIDDVAWFGLQKGRDEERRSCGPLMLEPLGAQIADFADTAAIIAQLDLVIAVDTSVVHLAGALGTPVWTLLPFAADWRWLLERTDSPWYPTMRLFRQPTLGDWSSVFTEVARALRTFASVVGGHDDGPACAALDEPACDTLDEPFCEPAALARAYYDRAKLWASQGDESRAISAYETAVRYAPDFAEAHSNLGNLYLQSGRRAEALRAYETAICVKPKLAPLYCNLAAVQIELGRCNEAIGTLETALRLAPDLYEARLNLCRAYERSGRKREAVAAALRATDLRPDPEMFVDLGVAAFELEAYDLVLDANRRALALDPTCALAYCNIGAIHHLMGRYTEAIAALESAIGLQPDLALAHFNLALSLLIRGDFERGWDEFIWEWRLPERRGQHPYLDRVPLWSGEEFADRELLITPDQGFGDAIQMVRYLPTVKARGGRVVLEVRGPLRALFADLPGVDELRVQTDSTQRANDPDLHIPLFGLPRALGTDLDSIPAQVPYLWPEPERVERWRPRLVRSARLRVGIAWAGHPGNDHDRCRSVRLEDFAVLGEIEGIAWFGLQKGRDEERRFCGSLMLDPLGSEISDFADTAAIIAELDLVIAVDTSVVHLAGALGQTVWTLLPFAPDWRWLLARDDSPWYPTMRLFRQPTAGDWAAVFADVGRALRTFEPAVRANARQSGDIGRPFTREDDSACDAATIGRMHYDRAITCASEGDVSAAILAYETAVTHAPDLAEAHSNLGNLYLQTGRRDDALRAYETAIRTNPTLAPLYCNLAAVQTDLGRCDEAISALETALRLAPDLYEAHAGLGQAFRRAGRLREALAPALRATDLRPDRDGYVYLGAAAFNLDAFDIALEAYGRALALDATCAKTHSNLGAVYHMAGRYAEAIDACAAAIALQPDFASAHVNLGLSLLVCGDFTRGWDEYVWMWRVPNRRARYPYLDRVPLWSGEAFAGRRLLITPDQGFGDAIQMIRYLPMVKALGGHVILEARAPLIELFENFAGADELRTHVDGMDLADDVDLQIPILGLARALGTDVGSIPAPIPYLRAQPERIERWRPRLKTGAPLRVGIVWSGNPCFAGFDRRSCRPQDFEALAGMDGIAWFSLQKGTDEELTSCGSLGVDPLGAEIADFADTAAILVQIDLLISSDTSIVHLAGALGMPVWTLLPFSPDWRWLLSRDDSPWYPTMRLFRQPATGDWASVFADVARELRTIEKPCRT